MPVFVNEVVIRASVGRPETSAAPNPDAGPRRLDRDTLVAEVKEALMDYLERELDRSGER